MKRGMDIYSSDEVAALRILIAFLFLSPLIFRHVKKPLLKHWKAFLGMGVLGNLPDERAPISLRHPVLGLDLDVGVDARLECALLWRHVVRRAHYFQSRVDHLRVHAAS